jgi:hypothetical protein
MPLLLTHELDSVNALWNVTHGVYVMQNVECGCLFRFGSLGLKSPNPAVCRLEQCFGWTDLANAVMERWRYILINSMMDQEAINRIQQAEDALYIAFLEMEDPIAGVPIERIGRMDRFRAFPNLVCNEGLSSTARDAVCRVATTALAAYL